MVMVLLTWHSFYKDIKVPGNIHNKPREIYIIQQKKKKIIN
jgi:hypothetical protein